MTIREKLLIAAALVLMAAIAVGAHFYIAERIARTAAEATTAAQQSVIQAADDRERLRDEQLQAALEGLQRQKIIVQTPAQAAVSIPAQLNPQLPQPITINVPPQTSEPATINVPQPDLKPLSDMIFDCSADKAKVQTLMQDKADDQVRIAALQKDVTTLQRAVKGGTWLQRLGKAAKYITIGGAIGIAATCGTGHCH